jgi:excisionase family DNA binding protein
MNGKTFSDFTNMEGQTQCSPYERLLTPREVARWLGVSDRWVRDHATRRLPRIPAVHLGSLLRFRRVDVKEFVETQLEKTKSNFRRLR